MKTTNCILTLPAQDGYTMPAEFELHKGCIIVYPQRAGSWIYGAKPARKTFAAVIAAIGKSEKVFIAAGKNCINDAVADLFGDSAVYSAADGVYRYCKKEYLHNGDWRENVEIFQAETDDAWARDIAPTFIKHKSTEKVCAVNWQFNAWGGKVDGLYAKWDKDDAFAKYFAQKYGYSVYDAAPFVLEGGSVHSDGEGTLMVTESCLLSKGRNPALTKAEIEQKLKDYLGADKVLWLPRGIYNDETNEHVDNICAFIRPAEAVLAWTDNQADPQYALSKASLDYLEGQTDAKGRKITVHKLPIPDNPICITQEELDGYTFEDGEDEREIGERLAASYVNFYYSNGAVVMPVFGGNNAASDERAVKIMQKLNPEREIIPVFARDILIGGGNIHCITQQIPAGKIKE